MVFQVVDYLVKKNVNLSHKLKLGANQSFYDGYFGGSALIQ
jgi:hypothetical protein